MDKYKNLDNDGRRSISANAEDAPVLDLAIEYLCTLLEIPASRAVTQAVILYAQDCGLELLGERTND